MTRLQIVCYTAFALFAFAGNSVLCRLALADGTIDPAGFTALRLTSGAVFLAIFFAITQVLLSREALAPRKVLAPREALPRVDTNPEKQRQFIIGLLKNHGSVCAAAALFIYAAAFSFAYISLETGTGALILFTTVQFTLVGLTLIKGLTVTRGEWLGIAVAIVGFIYLMLPSAEAPALLGALLMIGSGVAWGLYTWWGKQSKQPLADTTANFVRTLPFVLVLFVVSLAQINLSLKGAILALTSGILASGAGYAAWYAALRGLSGIQAAALQLLVPVIAFAGGVVFAGEQVTLPTLVASSIILCGIAIVIASKARG